MDIAVQSQNEAVPGLWTRVWRFARHFGEMCLAMCLGVAILDVLYVRISGQFGISEPFLRLPELSALVMAFNMTVPMAAWMRVRGMAWGPIAEMSGAMIAEAVVIIGAYWLGVLANVAVGTTTSLWAWQHGLMMPVMLIPMLLRLDLYTGHASHGSHGGHGHLAPAA